MMYVCVCVRMGVHSGPFECSDPLHLGILVDPETAQEMTSVDAISDTSRDNRMHFHTARGMLLGVALFSST